MLQDFYASYEEDSYAKLMKIIDDIGNTEIPRAMFVTFTNRIYKRKQ
jgi:hypothetical protein